MTVDTVATATSPTAALAPLATAGAALPDGLSKLREWASAATSAAQLVTPLVDTPFVPDSYRPKVDPRATTEEKAAARQVAVASATAAVLQGISLGLDPLVSLQQIYVVHGRPGMYARIKVALVIAAGHEIWTDDLTDTRAVVAGRRRGSEVVERVTVTMDQARRAGWTKNETYAKTPADMLYARAASRVCDRIAPDVLMGIASVEDIQDEAASEAPGAAQRTIRPPRARVTAQVTTAPQPGAQPAAAATGDDLLGYDEAASLPVANQEVAAPQPLDPAQWRKINARFVELEVVGEGQQAARLRVIRHIVGRPISRGGELTADEGQLVLDNLAGDAGYVVLGQALDRPGTSHSAEVPAAGTSHPSEVRDELLGDADPDADGAYDPSMEPGFGQDPEL
ncbi:hypothetical protein [Mycobacterium sp.]|uniref:hypothetical protein n=1 Tax=Mycobacterium sp. TaxID=1785 RepID=UPI002BBA8A5B|nr:hypothetical protein [Mycobacterium sp.]HTY35394.1 hypothetical protein [Mycobacterium sp.]